MLGIGVKWVLAGAALAASGAAMAENPIVPGWYADPEARVFGDRYWIYPTYSDDWGNPDVSPRFTPHQQELRKRKTVRSSYVQQTFFNAFSSPDLVHWTKHRHVFDVANAAWAGYAIWAPSVIEANGRYYMFFSANDIQSDAEVGGIGLAVSDKPEGPFKDALGKPLIGAFHNGAQPIDPFAFRDTDGQIYLFYGGWTGPDYSVAYAMGPSSTGPFKPMGKILAQDFRIVRGAGHHSVVNVPGTDDWYIVYHRRPLGDDKGEHRQVAIDRMDFAADGTIKPVVMTNEGVKPRPIAAGAKR